MEDEYKEITDQLIDPVQQDLKICINNNCRERNSASADVCMECNGTKFSETFQHTSVNVNEGRIAYFIREKLRKWKPDPEEFDISGWNTSKHRMNGRDIINTDFNITEYIKRGPSTSTRHEVFFVPQGNRNRSSKINDYLLNCVYITYGESTIGDYEGYGHIPLFDLLFDDSDEMFGKAIHDSITQSKGRAFRKAIDAHTNARKYLDILSEEDALTNLCEELNSIYDPKNDSFFEKQLFYLLKSLFVLSERWGRDFEKEADGLLVIPRTDSKNDYVAKYDAKLSHKKAGYGLGTKEEDQASRYMSNSAEARKLKAKTGRNLPSAHILISQNFNHDDFDRIAKGVQQNLSEYKQEETPDLVFMEFRAIIELFELKENHHIEMDNPNIKKELRRQILDELTSYKGKANSKYVHFNSNSVEQIQKALLPIIKQYDHDPVKTHSG